MKFAEPLWLLGAALSLVVLAFYVVGGLRLVKAMDRFGEREPVARLVSARAGGMRALKSGLVVVAVAVSFVALAGPQYGRGTRLIPATNLDCVIVLDYSKSMYARDVPPNRSERAKAEVSRLIADLPGARFGAVAFAGEPLSFPLTSDGGAIAQFFQQTSPNDMPIGGTAIARALESARELLERDPLSKKHQKVILLVTDGEDLEGDPVKVAQLAQKDNILTHVVQIGSRAPEPIPEVNEQGVASGIRRDRQGQPMMTALSAEGEAQLSKIAEVGGGVVVRAETGQTGISEIARRLKVMMTEELAEKVETVYADVFFYPLGFALLLLGVEVFVPTVRRRRALAAASTVGTVALVLLFTSGCDFLEESIFSRHSPTVDRAMRAIETRDAGAASAALIEYLKTGKCASGAIGVPESVKELPYASVDLGLALFQLAERYGKKFGEENTPQESEDPNTQALLAKRSSEIDCALRLVRVIAANTQVPLDLRAQAYYLSGNLEFLRFDYADAIESYDAVLKLSPGGLGDAGGTVGTNAAYNRAISQRRLEEQEKNKPPPPDGGAPKPPNDGGGEPRDDQDQKDQDQKDQDQKDQDQKDQDQKDQDQKDQDQKDQDQKDQDQKDQDQKDQDQKDQDQAAPQPAPPASSAPSLSQDDRMLDQLERAPMFQHAQPSDAQHRGRSTMEDK